MLYIINNRVLYFKDTIINPYKNKISLQKVSTSFYKHTTSVSLKALQLVLALAIDACVVLVVVLFDVVIKIYAFNLYPTTFKTRPAHKQLMIMPINSHTNYL